MDAVKLRGVKVIVTLTHAGADHDDDNYDDIDWEIQ